MMNFITHGDARDILDGFKDDSVDIIMTDPPYLGDLYAEAYGILADQAPRILRPGGWLITYAPQYYLPQIMGILGQGMEYFWIVAQLQKSNTTCIVHARKAMAMWKPILVFNKPPREMPPKAFCDTITGKKSKRYHPWEQSIHEALHLLTRFASPGDLVLDPFAGSGTIPLAAKLLGLRSVGIEIDADTWDTASQRMTQTPLDLFDYDCLEVQS